MNALTHALRLLPVRVLARLCLGLSPVLPCGATQAENAEVERIHVPSTKVWLTPPRGFNAATSFAGFQHLESGASIMVNEISGAYTSIVPGLQDKKALATKGMRLLLREELVAGEHPGVLMKVRQAVQRVEIEKWMWVFGSKDETVLVMGTYPAELAVEYGPLLRAAVVSAHWNPKAVVDPFEGLGFRLEHTGSLVFWRRMSNLLIYTADGEPDHEKLGKAMFLIGPSHQAVKIGKRRAFAERRLRQTVDHKDFKIESIAEVVVDGLAGFELVAGAVSDSDVPTTIYQLVLFEGTTYWLGQGLVRSSVKDEFLPTFQKTAHSFAREVKLFESANGLLRIRAPGGWTELDLDEEADLQIGHATAECYLTVLSEARSDLEPGTTLDMHSEHTRASLRRGLEFAREVGPRHLEIGGRKAVQYELHVGASASAVACVFLHTTVESERHFHEVLAWTVASAFADGRAGLEPVIESFEVTRSGG